MSDASPIDFDRIHDATGGDEEFMAELVQLFIEDAEERLLEIEKAVQGGEPTEIRATAHKLKGSSANVGANGLMRISKAIEDMGASGDVANAPEQVHLLAAEFARVKEVLQGML